MSVLDVKAVAYPSNGQSSMSGNSHQSSQSSQSCQRCSGNCSR
jgi:hypothetical protein